jgi:8-oxo-dGTP diphosphatase
VTWVSRGQERGIEVSITETEPVSREGHLEFRWLRLDQLTGAEVRPHALKNALMAIGDDPTPFWHGWHD